MLSCATGVITFIHAAQRFSFCFADSSVLSRCRSSASMRVAVERLVEKLGMVGQPAVVLADGQRRHGRHALDAHHLEVLLADRRLDDRVRHRVGAGVDRFDALCSFEVWMIIAHALAVVVADDLLEQILGQLVDLRPRAPAVLVLADLGEVGLGGQVLVEQLAIRRATLRCCTGRRDRSGSPRCRRSRRCAGCTIAPLCSFARSPMMNSERLPASNTVVTPA